MFTFLQPTRSNVRLALAFEISTKARNQSRITHICHYLFIRIRLNSSTKRFSFTYTIFFCLFYPAKRNDGRFSGRAFDGEFGVRTARIRDDRKDATRKRSAVFTGEYIRKPGIFPAKIGDSVKLILSLDLQNQNQKLLENSEKMETELLCLKTAEVNGILGGVEDDDSTVVSEDNASTSGGGGSSGSGVYKQRYERAVRELDYTKRRLQQQHHDDLEQLIALRKQLEKKVSATLEPRYNL